MSTENEEIEVVLDDTKPADTPVEVVKVDEKPAVAAKPEAPEVDPAEALADMRRKLDDERSGRLEAERRAREASTVAEKAQTETHETNLALVDNAIAGAKQKAEMLEARYAEAASSGDWATAAKAQTEMATNAAQLLTLEQGKAAMEAAPKQQPKAEPVGDPVEHLARQLTPRSAAWVRSHPEYATDTRLYQRMLAAHNLAVTDGIGVDTDDYFASVEKTLGIGGRKEPIADDEALSAASASTQRRSSPPAAPVSRSGTVDNPRPNTVRLTAQEVEMAEMMGMSPAEYAKNKLALIKDGKITTH